MTKTVAVFAFKVCVKSNFPERLVPLITTALRGGESITFVEVENLCLVARGRFMTEVVTAFVFKVCVESISPQQVVSHIAARLRDIESVTFVEVEEFQERTGLIYSQTDNDISYHGTP